MTGDETIETTETHGATHDPERAVGARQTRRKRLSRTIFILARDIDRATDPREQGPPGALDRGGVAELRRLDPSQAAGGTESAFWRLFVDRIEPDALGSASVDLDVRHWMAILAGMATTAGLNVGGLKTGAALRAAGVSEARLTKLLRAKGHRLFDEVRSVAHLVHSKGQRIDWMQLAELVLSERQPWGDAVRRKIAVDFYRPSKTDIKPTESET